MGSGSVEAGIVSVLVCLGCDVADRGMDPCTVVEGLDGGEDGLTSRIPSGEALAIGEFDLETCPEVVLC